ncbi:MAG: nucleotidyltransferase domain-containing protein [Bacilli bacterium]|nr:nucleotidyltransferase domain-containing protein [Bacilli bacterium]
MREIYSIDEISKTIHHFIQEHYHSIHKVILFGSYSRGEATSKSDIDLFICDSPEFVGMKTFAFGNDLKDTLGKDVDIFIENNVPKDSALYQSIMENGVIIYE